MDTYSSNTQTSSSSQSHLSIASQTPAPLVRSNPPYDPTSLQPPRLKSSASSSSRSPHSLRSSDHPYGPNLTSASSSSASLSSQQQPQPYTTQQPYSSSAMAQSFERLTVGTTPIPSQSRSKTVQDGFAIANNFYPGNVKRAGELAFPGAIKNGASSSSAEEEWALITSGEGAAQARSGSPAMEETTVPTMTYGKCMCCNSQLRFPLSVSRFRCTVCDTINDLRPQRFNGETPQPLTLQRIKLVVAQCKQASGPSVPFVTTQNAKGKRDAQDGAKPPPPGWEPLVKMVEEVFQNWESLNASFTNGQEVTLDDTGVALDQVREAYRILLDSPVNVIHAMMLSTDKILRRPGRLLCRKEDIKFLMIILENPLLSQHAYQQESHHHHNIMKHVFGLLSCLSNELHHYLVNWFARLNLNVFRKRVELVNSFTTHYLAKAQRAGRSFPAAYESDWRVISAARVMALMFAANNQSPKIPISEFYNTMVDYVDLVADYDSWQQRSGKFAFCQYPFLISMGSKMSVMELDARRQMETKVKEAILTILYQKRVTVPYLVLRVRRDNLIVDSLTQLAQHETDLKKSLKIEFSGEEGIDAGGLRKEWFQLLVRELFGPQYGMFTWDEDTNLCWFNPASFEASDQYYLVGVVIGLAIYNSTILDIHLPLPCYKKLLNIPVGLDDLKVFRPALARGLEQLLTFEGDVETTFCRDFVGEYEAFGEIVQVPLVPGGEKKPVTNENRVEYVQRYVKFILNDSIAKQFEPFMRGFYNVCGGNALSLFRPEEIELLVRGSDEPLEVEQLRAVTEYYGFNPDDETIRSFWAIFGAMAPKMQRKLLTFVTGSDRIPATGTANMTFKITCLGEDSERFPTAHTCFNQICLYRYRGRAKLERKLLTAINESQGFYFK